MNPADPHRSLAHHTRTGALWGLLVVVGAGCGPVDPAETDASSAPSLTGGNDAAQAALDASATHTPGTPPDVPSTGGPPLDAGASRDAAAVPDATAPGAPTGAAEEAGTPSGADAGKDADAQPANDAATDASTGACSGSLRAGDSTRSVNVGGMMRSYLLHIPANYDGQRRVPVVVDLHAIGGNGAGQKRGSGYLALSDKDGFLLAHPNGIDNAWNVGPCCTQSRSVDDVAFIRALVKDLETAACVDSSRVYATGFSMGGGMSHYLGCHAADVFAAIAPAAFDLLEENSVDCKPARPIPVLASRGTSDPVVPYQGGASRPPNGLNVTIHFLGAVETFKKWAELDQCTGTPQPAETGCQFYRTCAGGAEVGLCTATGGGHSYGDAQRGWAFLKRFSR